jgi:hypothetical protein
MAKKVIHFLTLAIDRDWPIGMGEMNIWEKEHYYITRCHVLEHQFLCGHKNSKTISPVLRHLFILDGKDRQETFTYDKDDQSLLPFAGKFTCRYTKDMDKVTCKKCIAKDTAEKRQLIIEELNTDITNQKLEQIANTGT